MRVRKPARMSRILRKMDQLTVRWAKVDNGVAASLIDEILLNWDFGPDYFRQSEGAK
jgi:hypothetical protein